MMSYHLFIMLFGYIYLYLIYVYIYIYIILAFIYSWCDIVQDFINSINVDVDVTSQVELRVLAPLAV